MIDEKKLKEQIFLWDTKKRPPGGIAFRQQIYNLFDKCRVDTRIEAAIRALEKPLGITWKKSMAMMKDMSEGKDSKRWGQMEADLLRWVLGQKQPTWKDSDFGLKLESR